MLDTLTIGEPGAPVFLVGVVSPGAPVARAPDRHPLVVLSHGTGGSPLQLAWLGIALARPGGARSSARRLALGPRIDTTRIGAAGFSLGGYTAVALAGGRTDLDQFEAFCASGERDFTCQSQTRSWWHRSLAGGGLP